VKPLNNFEKNQNGVKILEAYFVCEVSADMLCLIGWMW